MQEWIILSPRISEADRVERSQAGTRARTKVWRVGAMEAGCRDSYHSFRSQIGLSAKVGCPGALSQTSVWQNTWSGAQEEQVKNKNHASVSITWGRTGSGTVWMVFWGQGIQISCRHTKKELLTAAGSLRSAFTKRRAGQCFPTAETSAEFPSTAHLDNLLEWLRGWERGCSFPR